MTLQSPWRSLLVALVFTVPTHALAQEVPRTPVLKRITVPLRPARYDLATGTITQGTRARHRSLGGYTTASTLNNNDLSGFVGADSGLGTPGGPCEWIDAADKGVGSTGGASGLMTGFSFAYCSAARSVLSGGPGGRARIGFRAGYLAGPIPNGAGPSGTVAGTFNLSGLPANTGSSSFFGKISCYLISIDLGTQPVVLRDGPIGWSWQFRDLGTDGVLAATFPFLSCVQSCSGNPAGGGPMADQLDRYCPPGNYLSTFSFGTSAPGSAYFTSVSMDIREAESIAPKNVTFNGSGVNPLILSPVSGPVLGQPWTLVLDCNGADPSMLALWRLSYLSQPTPIPSAWGEILVALSGPGQNYVSPHGGTVAVLGGGSLPLDMSFYGVCWNVQGFCGDTPTGYLSNAVAQTVGFF